MKLGYFAAMVCAAACVIGSGIGFEATAEAYPSVYPTGVTRYNPDEAYNCFTLVPRVANYGKRSAAESTKMNGLPIDLIDMNGNVVHTWENVSTGNRARLLPNGHLVAIIDIGNDRKNNAIIEYDWGGNEVWRFPAKGSDQHFTFHHDFQRMPNGDTLAMYELHVPDEVLKDVEDADYPFFGKIKRKGLKLIGDGVMIISPKGEITWDYKLHEHLDINMFLPGCKNAADWSHANAVNYIPENHWYDEGDKRFKPGNILVNPRNFNFFLVIDRETKEIVYKGQHNLMGGLSGQHEPHMIKKGLPGAGNFLVFDNGAMATTEMRHGQSLAVEINPEENRIAWVYNTKGNAWRFYNHSRSSVQRLPNGNTLISADNTGRVFQIAPDSKHDDGGRIVWEYVTFNSDETPYFATARCHAYAYDYCPQFADLAKTEMKVTPPTPSEWKLLPDELRNK